MTTPNLTIVPSGKPRSRMHSAMWLVALFFWPVVAGLLVCASAVWASPADP